MVRMVELMDNAHKKGEDKEYGKQSSKCAHPLSLVFSRWNYNPKNPLAFSLFTHSRLKCNSEEKEK
jgi:hypothetical protein